MTDEQCVAIMAATIFMQVGGFTPEECAMEACDLFAAVQLERKRRFTANGMDGWIKDATRLLASLPGGSAVSTQVSKENDRV